MGLFDNEKVDIDNWPAVPEVSPCVSYLVNDMLELDRLLTNINSELSSYTGLGNFYSSVQGKVLTFQEKASYLAQSGWMVSDIKDEIEDPFRQRISGAADEICSVDAAQFTTENTIGLKGYVTTTVNDGITSRTSKSTIVLDSLNLTDFLGADRESMTTVSHSGGGATYTTTTTTIRDSDPHFSGLFRESYDKYIEQARWNNGMISHMPDGVPELHYMETMSYEEYLSALVPKDREYDRYAGAWNEMLAESFDAFLGLGLIYKAVTGEEAFTGDKLTQNEREEAAASGAFALTVSVLTSAIGGTGWSGFATMLLADAAGGVVGVVTYEGLTNMGLSDSEAFLLSFFAGVVTGNGIERMAYSSPTYIDDLAKRMGKSSDEVADMLGDLSDVAAKYNYSSVDDMLNNLSPAARDDIMKMFDKPLGSFDLDKVDDFKVKNQVFDAKRSYKEILKNSDDIKQIAKNTGLDTEDVKKVKDYLFKEKHLMPDGTYRQFDASEEIADAWKRLTNGKATDEDLLLFNHELTELRFVEEGFSVDAAHILSSVDYNWSSVSKIDDFAKKCSEIYGKDFYFGAGTSNEAIDAIVKQIDNLDGQVDDLIEGGVNSYNDFSNAVKSIGTRTDLTDSQKVDMLQKLFEKSSYKTDINVPCDIKYVKRIDGDGIDYNWPPKLGFDESTVKPISKTDGLPDVWDRYGYMGGSSFSDVPSTGKYTYSERALPYIENEAAYHVGSGFNDVSYFDKIDAIRNGDIDALNNILESEGLKKVTDEAFGRYVKQYCDYENKVAKAFGGTMYNAPYGISGHAARWKDLSGGAPQYTFPLSGESMIDLGIMS